MVQCRSSPPPPAVEVTVKGATSLTQTHTAPYFFLLLISNLIVSVFLAAESAEQTILFLELEIIFALHTERRDSNDLSYGPIMCRVFQGNGIGRSLMGDLQQPHCYGPAGVKG